MSTPSTARSHVSAGHAEAHTAESAIAAKPPASSRRWWILAIIGIAQLMLVLDSTIVNIALPSAQRALGFADSDRVWIVTAYALTFGSFLLLGGRLGDIFGRKWTFIGGLAGFAVASAGVVLASGGLFALVFGFSRAQTDSWGSVVTLTWLVIGVALLAAFVQVQRLAAHPLLPLRVVLDRNRAGAYAAIGLTFIAVFALFFFLTFYLQDIRGDSPVKTGVAFLPLPVALVVSSGISTVRLFPRFGPRPLIVPGLLIAGVGMALLSRLGVDSGYAAHVLPALVITGVGFGAIVPPALSTATQGVEFRDAGVAAGTANTMQQVGGSIGTSLLTAIAAQATARSLGGHPVPGADASTVALAVIHGYSVGFQVAAGIFLGAAVICALLLRKSADQPGSSEPDSAAAI